MALWFRAYLFPSHDQILCRSFRQLDDAMHRIWPLEWNKYARNHKATPNRELDKSLKTETRNKINNITSQ